MDISFRNVYLKDLVRALLNNTCPTLMARDVEWSNGKAAVDHEYVCGVVQTGNQLAKLLRL